MKVLFITTVLPYPLDGGAKIRTFNLMKNVVSKHEVTLLSFVESKDEPGNINELEHYGFKVETVKRTSHNKLVLLFNLFYCLFRAKPFVIQKYYSSAMRNKINDLIGKYKFDIVQFEHLHMAQYLSLFRSTHLILAMHNIDSVIAERYCREEKNMLKKAYASLQWKKLRKYESVMYEKFDICLTVSEKDNERLKQISPKTNAAVIPNGVDTTYFKLSTEGNEPNSLVFTGMMNWLPNVDAMLYFCKHILPLIEKEVAGVKLYIVGRNPLEKVKELGKEHNIVVSGAVDDIRPYVRRSSVVIVPLRIGGGTRLKILEAMSMGKPVVSTSIGCEGLEVIHGENIIIADTSSEFAVRTIDLLKGNIPISKLGENGRKLVCEKYDWEKIGQKLCRIYEDIIKQKL